MSTEVRLVGGTVVTMDAQRRVIDDGEVAFDTGTGLITYVGPGRGVDGGVDVTGRVLMPGLVNAHTHSGMTPLRGYAEDLDLQDWLARVRAFEVELTADDFLWGLQLAMVEMLRTGTTTFADMFLWNSRLLGSVVSAGMRVLAAPVVFGYDAVAYPGASADDGRSVLDGTAALASEFAGDSQVRIALGPHAPYTCSPEELRVVAARARSLELPVHIHLSESAFEVEDSQRRFGLTPIAHVAALGLLESPVLVAHCVHPTHEDIEILARHDVAVAHNPISNLKLGAGVAPVPALREAGVPLGLGTDSVVSNNNLDLFEEIKTGVLLQRGVNRDPKSARGDDLLAMATCEGAQAVRFPEVGSLQPGRWADVVVVDATGSRGTPLHDAASFLTFAASGSDVRDVYVGGRQVVAERRVTSVNEAEARSHVAATAARVAQQVARRRG